MTRGEAVQLGPQPPAHQLRGRHPRGPVDASRTRTCSCLTSRPDESPRQARVRRDRLRGGRPGGGQRRAPVAGGTAREAQRNRRPARHRPRRSRREPLRRHEVARRLRDAGRDDPARRAPRRRVAHPRPRGHAPARLAHPALRRDGLLRLLVRARAPDAADRHRRVAEARVRHRAPQALQRAT